MNSILAELTVQKPLYNYATAEPPPFVDDTKLVERIAGAFRLSAQEFCGHRGSFWGSFEVKHQDIATALDTNNLNALGRLLRDPAETELFWGFDDLVKPFVLIRSNQPSACNVGAEKIYGSLIQAAIGSGAIRCPYPEAGQGSPQIPIEELLMALDQRFGYRVEFPNPFRGEFGIRTSRGIVSDRAAQALYQSWRVKQICDLVEGARVLEIGAGLGRNAFFARCFGINNYTIVDIPRTQLAQGYYLGRIMGPDAISLCGETDKGVCLRSPGWLLENDEAFDVILNVDSLTELDRDHALSYVRFAKGHASAFLSINHEFNPATADELLREASMKVVHRSPYWPRAGYVEELILPSLDTLHKRLKAKGDEPNAAGDALNAIKSSAAWRVAAPLRWIKSRF